MRKFFVSILMCLSLGMHAQSVVENARQQLEEAKSAQKIAKQAIKEAKKAAKLQEKLAKLKAKEAVEVDQQAVTPRAEEKATAPTKSAWIVPQASVQAKHITAKKATQDNETMDIYLAGAVPVVDGKVVFTLDQPAPGKSAGEIYEQVYRAMQEIATAEGQIDSRIALVNEAEHTIAARYKEWMVFSDNFLSLDRTEFNYVLIAKCTDGMLHLTMDRIHYAYETDRSTGFKSPAEKLITDEYALNKKGDKLVKVIGKFRKNTIKRKNEIFASFADLLK